MRRSLAPHAHVPAPLRFTPAEIAGQQAERLATGWHRLAIALAFGCAVLVLIR